MKNVKTRRDKTPLARFPFSSEDRAFGADANTCRRFEEDKAWNRHGKTHSVPHKDVMKLLDQIREGTTRGSRTRDVVFPWPWLPVGGHGHGHSDHFLDKFQVLAVKRFHVWITAQLRKPGGISTKALNLCETSMNPQTGLDTRYLVVELHICAAIRAVQRQPSKYIEHFRRTHFWTSFV